MTSELAAPPASPWQRLRSSHLHDYAPRAAGAWLAIAAAGALALGWALARVLLMPVEAIGAVLIGAALVGLVTMYPLPGGRADAAPTAGDLFNFALLALLGAPAAVLGAGIDALATLRSSPRLSSRVAAPASAMASMALAGAVFEALRAAWSARLGDAAATAALLVAAPLFVALNVVVLTVLRALKDSAEGAWPAAGDMLRDLGRRAWIAAAAVVLGGVAGLAQLAVLRGALPAGVLAAVATAAMLLLHFALAGPEAAAQARAEREREAADRVQRAARAFAGAAVGIAIARDDGIVLQTNRAFAGVMGRAGAEIAGQRFESALHAGDAELFRRRFAESAEAVSQAAPFSMELRCRTPDARDHWIALHCSRLGDAGGELIVYEVHDITSRRRDEHRLRHIAYHDSLTDLANASCFHERLGVAVDASREDANVRFAVLLLDLDRFKVVNDSLGHAAGNELLRAVASRLREAVRPADLAARLGGDEFAVLLEGLAQPEDGQRVAERVQAALAKPVTIYGTEVLPGASIGITFSDHGYRTVDEVLRDADLAMSEAKGAGRGRIARFDSAMQERVADKAALENDLRQAIGAGQLSIQFQPLYELDPHRLYGFEALMRWMHPVRGPVEPRTFIAVAEESGHIDKLSDWVIEHAVAQLAAWRKRQRSSRDLCMHVNISGRDLGRSELPGHVERVLQRHGVPAHALTLEITETVLMGSLDAALQTLQRLRALGVRLSIDDFGTGYSSLAYLSTLPIDSLKIDRSFVMAMEDKPQNLEIVRAVLNLGHSLGRRVIAEGIETQQQLATLRELGVTIGQGFLLSKPLRAEQVPRLLALPVPMPA